MNTTSLTAVLASSLYRSPNRTMPQPIHDGKASQARPDHYERTSGKVASPPLHSYLMQTPSDDAPIYSRLTLSADSKTSRTIEYQPRAQNVIVDFENKFQMNKRDAKQR
ncbi:hypothetical protein F4779DRAFT_624145 [Xylariaceae sp. FL0662B]|nr:hypothetical protein F4779DRAFT_624145 [Xylariaceae sp. FL0662B]